MKQREDELKEEELNEESSEEEEEIEGKTEYLDNNFWRSPEVELDINDLLRQENFI